MRKIEEVIQLSLTKEMAVLLKLKGCDPIVTAIESFINKEDLKLIQIKPETLYGQTINETVIHLQEVESIAPLFVSYNEPVYVKLRQIKKLIKQI